VTTAAAAPPMMAYPPTYIDDTGLFVDRRIVHLVDEDTIAIFASTEDHLNKVIKTLPITKTPK
jgi:hypothetical protein